MKQDQINFSIVEEMIEQNYGDPRYRNALKEALPETKTFFNNVMDECDKDAILLI